VCEVAETLDIKLKPAIATKQEYCWRELFSCTTTVLSPMLRLQQDRQIETSRSRFCHIHLTAPTSHRAIFLPAVLLKRYYAVVGWAVMKCKKRCVQGFGSNLSNDSPMEPGRMWTAIKSLWNYREAMLKNRRVGVYISLSLSLDDIFFTILFTFVLK
jgi:hypothetical protein